MSTGPVSLVEQTFPESGYISLDLTIEPGFPYYIFDNFSNELLYLSPELTEQISYSIAIDDWWPGESQYFLLPGERAGHRFVSGYGAPSEPWYALATATAYVTDPGDPSFLRRELVAPRFADTDQWLVDLTTNERSSTNQTNTATSPWAPITSPLPVRQITLYLSLDELGQTFTLHSRIPGQGGNEQLQSVTAEQHYLEEEGIWTSKVTGTVGIGMEFWLTRTNPDETVNVGPVLVMYSLDSVVWNYGGFPPAPPPSRRVEIKLQSPGEWRLCDYPNSPENSLPIYVDDWVSLYSYDAYGNVDTTLTYATAHAYIPEGTSGWVLMNTQSQTVGESNGFDAVDWANWNPMYSSPPTVSPGQLSVVIFGGRRDHTLSIRQLNPDGTESTQFTFQPSAPEWDPNNENGWGGWQTHYMTNDLGATFEINVGGYSSEMLYATVNGQYTPLHDVFVFYLPYDSQKQFRIVDETTGEPAPWNSTSLSTWYPAPSAKTLTISSSRWDHKLWLCHVNGDKFPIQQVATAGDLSLAANQYVWLNSWYYFNATTAWHDFLDWWVEDHSTGAQPERTPKAAELAAQGLSINDYLKTWTTLAAPTNLSGVLLSGRKISLSWTRDTSNSTGFYIVQRRTVVSTAYTDVSGWSDLPTTVPNSGAVQYLDRPVQLNTTYEYRVRLERNGRRSDPSNVVTVAGPVDSDRDGLSDEEEQAGGTLVNVADSDGNGVVDGDEGSIDTDTDGNGVPDIFETDSDGDGTVDLLDTDDDGDGVTDAADRYPKDGRRSADISRMQFVAINLAKSVTRPFKLPTSPVSNRPIIAISESGNVSFATLEPSPYTDPQGGVVNRIRRVMWTGGNVAESISDKLGEETSRVYLGDSSSTPLYRYWNVTPVGIQDDGVLVGNMTVTESPIASGRVLTSGRSAEGIFKYPSLDLTPRVVPEPTTGTTDKIQIGSNKGWFGTRTTYGATGITTVTPLYDGTAFDNLTVTVDGSEHTTVDGAAVSSMGHALWYRGQYPYLWDGANNAALLKVAGMRGVNNKKQIVGFTQIGPPEALLDEPYYYDAGMGTLGYRYFPDLIPPAFQKQISNTMPLMIGDERQVPDPANPAATIRYCWIIFTGLSLEDVHGQPQPAWIPRTFLGKLVRGASNMELNIQQMDTEALRREFAELTGQEATNPEMQYADMTSDLLAVGAINGWPALAFPLEIRARGGLINDGFDPPLVGDVDVNGVRDEDNWVPWTRASRSGSLQVNTITELSVPSAGLAKVLEVVPAADSVDDIEVLTPQPDRAIYPLAFKGRASDTTAVEMHSIHIRTKASSGGQLLAAMKVMVVPSMPSAGLRFHFVEDRRWLGELAPNGQWLGTKIWDGLGGASVLADEADLRFSQIGVELALLGPTELRDVPYLGPPKYYVDPEGQTGPRWDDDGLNYEDNKLLRDTFKRADYPGAVSTILVHRLISNQAGYYSRETELCFLAFDKWYPDVVSPPARYPFWGGPVDEALFSPDGLQRDATRWRIFAHEVGHALLPQRSRPKPKDDGHDYGISPSATDTLMRQELRKGKWIRHDDWLSSVLELQKRMQVQ